VEEKEHAMAGARIRKNDTVQVISGKDKGKRGRVIEVLPKAARVRVEGVNKIKRHTKPNPQKNVKGGIVEREDPVHVSNVALVDPKSDKPTRVGMKVMADGTRLRVAMRSGMPLDK
jgi:large subunit ribosomal protein L24